jgi:hypothetical protein
MEVTIYSQSSQSPGLSRMTVACVTVDMESAMAMRIAYGCTIRKTEGELYEL